MDWNRTSAHELVGYASISDVELNSLVTATTGYVCELSVPVINKGVIVDGHDRQKCHVNLKIRVVQALPKAADAPQVVRKILPHFRPLFNKFNLFHSKN
jgi:hypothetical protein